MSKLELEATRRTPAVTFDPAKGTYRLEGNSTPEDAMKFYTPLIQWVEQNGPALTGEPHFEIVIRDFNTASMKCMIYLINAMDAAREACPGIRVTWHCDADDPDMFEVGQDIRSMVKLPLNITVRETK